MISPRRLTARPELIGVAGAALLIAVGYGALSVWRHAHFRTNGHDVGIFDQVLWALSRFEAPATTVRLIPLPNIFGDHFNVILTVLVPWYWIFGSPIVLLAAQAVLFAAVVPLGFLVARQLGLPPGPAAVLSVAFGVHPGFTAAALFEFHEIAFAAVLLLALVWLAERRQWRWYWVALASFLATKESMALYAALFGVTLILRRQWKIGAATFVVGLGYFLVVTSLVMPALAQQDYTYWRIYPELGGSPGRAVEHVVRHPVASVELLVSTPEKRRTINLMLASFVYLPLLSWSMWPMLFTTLAERFWSSMPELWGFRYHYQVIMTTAFFVATAYVLRDAGSRLPRRWPVKPAASIVILLATLWTIPASGVWNDAFTTAPASTIERWRAAVRLIPSDTSVSAQGPFVPHLTHRPTIYQFPRIRDAEYVILDPQAVPWPLTPAEIRAAQEQLPKLGWQIAWQQDTTTVFRRTPQSRLPTPPPLWD